MADKVSFQQQLGDADQPPTAHLPSRERMPFMDCAAKNPNASQQPLPPAPTLPSSTPSFYTSLPLPIRSAVPIDPFVLPYPVETDPNLAEPKYPVPPHPWKIMRWSHSCQRVPADAEVVNKYQGDNHYSILSQRGMRPLTVAPPDPPLPLPVTP
eukprot:754890-Hanusia_phi.AAC.10